MSAGGSIIFPHVGIEVCGHQIASAVHACLNCGAERVLVVGVLHALTQELQDARVRVANGSEVTQEYSKFDVGPELSKIVGGTLIMAYLLLGFAVVGIVFTEFNKIFK